MAYIQGGVSKVGEKAIVRVLVSKRILVYFSVMFVPVYYFFVG